MTYKLELDYYSGPLDKLLELIEGRKLDITRISLAEVTDDFLQYLKKLVREGEAHSEEASYMRLLADFIVVASRLIFIKSKSLLPELTLSEEEDQEIKELEERLRRYRELKPAMNAIARLWKGRNKTLARPYFLHLAQGVFYPPHDLNPAQLSTSLGKLFEYLQKLVLERSTLRVTIVSLEEKIKEIIGLVQKLNEARFSSLSSGKSRSEVIAAFLAILHLAREQLIFLEQENHLSDIIIKKLQT